MQQLDDIINHLETAAESLDELAYNVLRDAVANGETRRPAVEKQLIQSRRAVEKALSLLRLASAG